MKAGVLKMYSAQIEIGFINMDFEGETAAEILHGVEQYQDFDCLLMMGRRMGTKKDAAELNKLEEFLDKYIAGTLTIDDLRALNIHLSAGDFICHGVREIPDADN